MSDINRQQKYLAANIFSQSIVEQEQELMIKLEQYRRKKGMNLHKRIRDKIDINIMKGLEKIFFKKIIVILINVKDENVISATFIFNDDVILWDKENKQN